MVTPFGIRLLYGSLFDKLAPKLNRTPAIKLALGMRPNEETVTLNLLDALLNLPLEAAVADRARRLIYQYQRQGVTVRRGINPQAQQV